MNNITVPFVGGESMAGSGEKRGVIDAKAGQFVKVRTRLGIGIGDAVGKRAAVLRSFRSHCERRDVPTRQQ